MLECLSQASEGLLLVRVVEEDASDAADLLEDAGRAEPEIVSMS